MDWYGSSQSNDRDAQPTSGGLDALNMDAHVKPARGWKRIIVIVTSQSCEMTPESFGKNFKRFSMCERDDDNTHNNKHIQDHLHLRSFISTTKEAKELTLPASLLVQILDLVSTPKSP